MPKSLHLAARWYALAASIVLLDQATKHAATALLDYGRPNEIFFWFDFTLHYNVGAAFSFLSSAGGWQRWFFTILSLLVSAMLVLWLKSLQRSQWVLGAGLALILGGALGNVWDRIVLGYVVDFISVHYRDWYFPTFNIADAAISVGAVLVVIDSLISDPDDGIREAPARGKEAERDE